MTNEIKVHDKTFRILIKSDDIQARISELGSQINFEYQDKKPVFIGVLTGAFMFTSDLIKHFHGECELAFIRVASYEGTASTGAIKNLIGLKEDIKDRHVIIVEDIVDTGDTAKHLLTELKKHEPQSIKLASLIFKPASLRQDVKPDYVGFEIPSHFIIGFGLDYDGLARNLNDVYILKES